MGNEGTPLHGDRSAWDAIGHGGEHAIDIDDSTLRRHLPLPGAAGGYARSDGTDWQRVGELALADIASYARGSIIRGGASDWEAHAAETDGAALVGDGTDIGSTLTPTWKGLHTFETGITLSGASGANNITVPDNVALAVELLDAGGLEYLRVVSTDAQPVVRWNPASADVDFHVSATGAANALFVRGSDGNVGIGTVGPTHRLDILQSHAGSTYARIRNLDTAGLAGLYAVGDLGGVTLQVVGSTDATTSWPGYGRLRSDSGVLGLVLATGGTNPLIFVVSNAERMRVHTDGRVGVNETTPGAQHHITTSAAAVVGQIIKGAAGQTANLEQWQDNAGTVLACVDKDGQFAIGSPTPGFRLDLSDPANDADYNEYIRFGAHNTSTNLSGGLIWSTRYAGYTKFSAKIAAVCEGNYFRQGLAFYTGNDEDAITDAVERVRIDMDGKVGIGTTEPDRLFHIEVSDAVTNTITYGQRLTHITSNTAAALFGVGVEHELEDANGNMQVASEVATLWATATSGVESPLYRGTTYPKGSAGPGYWGFWTYDAIADAAITIVPNGTGDVPSGATIVYRLSESGGGVDGNTVMVTNGNSVDLYDDGTDILTLTVNADGSVTVVRTAGAATFDLAAFIIWL